MKHANLVAFLAALFLVVGFTAAIAFAVDGFNPTPSTTQYDTSPTCAAGVGVCPSFSIGEPLLQVHTVEDVTSQVLYIDVSVFGNATLVSMNAVIDGSQIGGQSGLSISSGTQELSFGIPTTTLIKPGASYSFLIEGIFSDGAGKVAGTYWQSVQVTAQLV